MNEQLFYSLYKYRRFSNTPHTNPLQKKGSLSIKICSRNLEIEKMVAGSFTIEMDSPVEAKRLWNSTKDMHNFLPKEAPGLISSVTLVQGDGGVGTIKQLNFTEANKDFSYVKEKVDLIDEANMVYCYSHVEGGVLGKKVASVSYKIKYVPKPGGGTLVIYTCNYDSLPGVPHDEAKIEEIKANTIALFRQVEQSLIANPTAYC